MAREQCLANQLHGVVRLANKGKDPDFILQSFVYSFHEAVLREALAERPIIAKFNRIEHERKIDIFRELDKKWMETNRQYLAVKHYERIPARVEPSSTGSQMGIIESEIRKKRRHRPIRKLMLEAGQAIQKIKPCFMMSPMSIAQFLPPGSIEFDLVIFDEASQVKPEDALGAIARGKQLVVVGDSNQLPPTSFFNKVTGSDDEEEEYEEDIRDYDSILEKCRFPSTSLRIHYRSRHQSLIQFSNSEFYNNKLVLFPSPDNSSSYCGVRFHYVEDGVYDRGRSRRNEIEAQRVAEYVMEHARNCPDLSLGVGTFSIAQRDAIEDALELLRRDDTSCESFFASSKHEPFFVKNLENIQGDERDVIVLSVGYGKDANGYLSMSFGPINKEGGWRRLNVLITRARMRVEVFSSITYRDIDLSKTSARGVRILKSYLEFAETGNLNYPRETQREIGSEFQAAVMEELKKHGLEVEPEVGVAGFFIDIGVKDPDNPGFYVIGIECDGATYHSARSARDRDRLRQQILEDLGWTIHRVWSVDWFNNREKEIRKVLEAYEKARAKAKPTPLDDKRRKNNPSEITTIRRVEEKRPILNASTSMLTIPYVVTQVKDVFYERKPKDITQKVALRTIMLIVSIEGPIHINELVKRCSQIWGYKRTGNRIREIVMKTTRYALGSGKLSLKGQFIWPAEMDTPPLRNRSVQGAPKNINMIPPEEIALLAQKIREIHVGINQEELAKEVAHHLGINRITREVSRYIQICLTQKTLYQG